LFTQPNWRALNFKGWLVDKEVTEVAATKVEAAAEGPSAIDLAEARPSGPPYAGKRSGSECLPYRTPL